MLLVGNLPPHSQIRCSLLPIPDSRFPIPDSRFPTIYNSSTEYDISFDSGDLYTRGNDWAC
ncbi:MULTISPECIES: hypothetical protein [Moorena]|uniref:hypothetical protein n=1 Tax=Moorena TaxID=1155738 RepID=UPI001429FF91|nr:hypothetical protein [Moorena sp. SIO4G3]NEO81647.1 hypothetical protein [Moorena sp. SIO4G3]